MTSRRQCERSPARRALGFGLAALLILGSHVIRAAVVFSMDIRFGNDVPTRILDRSQTDLVLFVWADNTTESKETTRFEWQIEAPDGVACKFIYPHDPYFHHLGTGPIEDLLCPFPIAINNVQFTNNIRMATTGGPMRTNGVIAAYAITVLTNNPLGAMKIRVRNTKAYAADGTFQPSFGTEASMVVIFSYAILDIGPAIVTDRNQGIQELFVTRFTKQQAIEATESLHSPWQEIFRSTNYDSRWPNPWRSFRYIDFSSTNHPTRFYRVKCLD
jgi:hypothetical protein